MEAEPSGKLLMTSVFKILSFISIIIYLPSSTKILPSGDDINYNKAKDKFD